MIRLFERLVIALEKIADKNEDAQIDKVLSGQEAMQFKLQEAHRISNIRDRYIYLSHKQKQGIPLNIEEECEIEIANKMFNGEIKECIEINPPCGNPCESLRTACEKCEDSYYEWAMKNE